MTFLYSKVVSLWYWRTQGCSTIRVGEIPNFKQLVKIFERQRSNENDRNLRAVKATKLTNLLNPMVESAAIAVARIFFNFWWLTSHAWSNWHNYSWFFGAFLIYAINLSYPYKMSQVYVIVNIQKGLVQFRVLKFWILRLMIVEKAILLCRILKVMFEFKDVSFSILEKRWH